MVKPYLPDIIQGCVARVSTSFSTRTQDPFAVGFEKGLLPQVRRSVYKNGLEGPLIWFVMKYAETIDRKKNGIGVYSSAEFQIIIALPTQNTYTQQQRDDLSYKARLLPVYEMLKYEIGREKWFSYNGDSGQDHTCILEPYWAMGDVGGTDLDNLFKGKKVDAVSLVFRNVKVIDSDCISGGGYDVADPGGPTITGTLTFFEDLELIVSGPLQSDPVHESTSVVIPELIGRDYEVQQRALGQLRKRRDVEFIPDEINGGFQLQDGLKFYKGDTYIVKIRPAYII